jgi:hypothetical protein
MTSFGDKHVSDRCSDACFHGRVLQRPHARFATLTPAQGTAAALVLSPTTISAAAAGVAPARPSKQQ